jgi:hypothetical protein
MTSWVVQIGLIVQSQRQQDFEEHKNTLDIYVITLDWKGFWLSTKFWLLRWILIVPPLTMQKQTMWCGNFVRFGFRVATFGNNVKVVHVLHKGVIHSFVIKGLNLSSFQTCLICIVTSKRYIHLIIFLCSLSLLTTSMMHYVWFGGKNLLPKSNMLPFFVGDYMFHQTNPIIKIMGLIDKEAWVIIVDEIMSFSYYRFDN